MNEYIHKPTIVKAAKFVRGAASWPTGVCVSQQQFKGEPFVHTWGGPVKIEDGDWVVQSETGECYPVKESVFLGSYEEVIA